MHASFGNGPDFWPPMKRGTGRPRACFVLVAVCGYLLLRDWLSIPAHHVYAVGLGMLVCVSSQSSTVGNRQIGARGCAAAVPRAPDKSLATARAAEIKISRHL